MTETSGFCQVLNSRLYSDPREKPFSKDNVGLWTFLHVPAHINTVGDFQTDWRKCNPIKSSKVNGNGKKHRSVPEVRVPKGGSLEP